MLGATADPTERLAGRAKQRGRTAAATAKESILKIWSWEWKVGKWRVK